MAMAILIIGLILFIGAHSTRMLVPDWRQRQIDRLGEKSWKGRAAIASLVGMVLLIIGYAFAHGEQTSLWESPQWLNQLTGILMLVAFVLMSAAHIQGSKLRAYIGHPLVAGVGLWALAHLMSTGGRLADLFLFGLFALWAFSSLFSLRRRDRHTGVSYSGGRLVMDGAALGVGLLIHAAFVLFLHQWLFGQPVF